MLLSCAITFKKGKQIVSFQAMGRPRNALFATADVYRSELNRKIQHRGTEDITLTFALR